MRTYFIAIIVFSVCSCGENNIKTDKMAIDDSSSQVNAQAIIFNADTIIATPCAIFISPADNKFDSLNTGDQNDIDAAAVDNAFYLSKTMQYLDSTKTPCIHLKSTGRITFRLPDKKWVDINLSKFSWGVLLFNGKADPIEGDVTDIHSDYIQYMLNWQIDKP